jgi:hypothetical protein
MRHIRLILPLFMLAACGAALAQLLAQPNQSRVRIVVFYDDGRSPVRDAMVELMDAVGGTTSGSQKRTDPDGRVEFNTITGGHRVRITSPTTEPFESEFEIAPVEGYHQENFRVRRKADAESTPSEPGGFVPAIRMKIPDDAKKEFEKGSRDLEDKKWQTSREHFQAAIKIYPDYDLAYNGLGVASSQLMDINTARQAFEKAIELNDKFAGAQRNLARMMISEHNFERAAALLNQSLTTEPANAWALTNAAYAELQLHRFKEAAEHAVKVHTLPHEGLANAHVIAGYAYDALGQREQSVEQWKLYLKEDPKGLNAKKAQAEVSRLTKAPQS